MGNARLDDVLAGVGAYGDNRDQTTYVFVRKVSVSGRSDREAVDRTSAERSFRDAATSPRKVEDLKQDGVSVEFALLETRSPAQAIAEFAREVDADLIVAGTSGSSRLVRMLVGSVTRRLLELAPCPVLAVPPEDEDIEPD